MRITHICTTLIALIQHTHQLWLCDRCMRYPNPTSLRNTVAMFVCTHLVKVIVQLDQRYGWARHDNSKVLSHLSTKTPRLLYHLSNQNQHRPESRHKYWLLHNHPSLISTNLKLLYKFCMRRNTWLPENYHHSATRIISFPPDKFSQEILGVIALEPESTVQALRVLQTNQNANWTHLVRVRSQHKQIVAGLYRSKTTARHTHRARLVRRKALNCRAHGSFELKYLWGRLVTRVHLCRAQSAASTVHQTAFKQRLPWKPTCHCMCIVIWWRLAFFDTRTKAWQKIQDLR